MQSTTSCISKRNSPSLLSTVRRIIHTNGQAKTRSRSALSSLTSVAANLICKLSKIYHPQPLVYFKTKCRCFVGISRSSYYRCRCYKVHKRRAGGGRYFLYIKTGPFIRMHSRPRVIFFNLSGKSETSPLLH